MRRVPCRSVRIRPGGAFLALSRISLVLGVILAFSALRLLLSEPALVLVAAVAWAPHLAHWRASRARAEGEIEAGSARLFVCGRDIPIERVRGAFARGPHELVVDLEDRTRVELDLVDATSEEVLGAIGWDLAKQTMRAPLRGGLGAFTQGFIAFVASSLVLFYALGASLHAWLGAPLALFAPLLLAALFTWAWVRRFASPYVLIGTDGLRIHGGLRPRYVRYADIIGVAQGWTAETNGRPPAERPTWGAVTLSLRDGSSLELPLVGQEGAEVRALATRIEGGLAAAQSGASIGLRALERGDRPFEKWRVAVESLAEQRPGYRDVALTPELLQRELSDGSAPSDRRVGAAIVLVALGEGERVRRVAGTCADDDMRAALEAVCDEALDEPTLARATRP